MSIHNMIEKYEPEIVLAILLAMAVEIGLMVIGR